jgi:nicotinamidase-related amidase
MMSEGALEFLPERTALVIVDLQNFTIAMNTVPIPATEVLANNVRLADACREAGILVVLIRVGHDQNKMPHPAPRIDAGFSGFQMDAAAKEIAPTLGPKPGDVIVDKYNWGAFHGTNLDTQLRRRGIDTLIMTGLVTNIGVDTTMREAQAHGYHQVMVSDAVAAMSMEEHAYTLKYVSPRLAQVRTTDEVLTAIGSASA